MTDKPRILVIDDQKAITDLIEEMAREEGVEVSSVNLYDKIRPAYRDYSPHLIFLDLDLGMDEDMELGDRGYDGLDILRWFAEQNCKSLIILMSGLDQDKLELTAEHGRQLKLKVTGVLPKPFSLEQISDISAKLKVSFTAAQQRHEN